MKVAAYQAPLPATNSTDVIDLIRDQVACCEAQGVEILCCPEGVLGGLADYVRSPTDIAIDVESGQLHTLLAPLASDRVTTILGFTEIDRRGLLYNSAAVFHQGSVVGIYRKLYPAINHSVYAAGDKLPVFTVNGLTFGIIICLDSNYYEPARIMAAQGAAALFVPTNNGLPPTKAGPELVDQARNCDIARAIENSVSVIRADVAGRTESLVSYGSSGIVNPDGMVLQSARQLGVDLIVADIKTSPDRARDRSAVRRPFRARWFNGTLTGGSDHRLMSNVPSGLRTEIPFLEIYSLTRVLTGLLFGVTATDPTTFIAAPLLLLLVAGLSCYLPARRAAKVDPLVALRSE